MISFTIPGEPGSKARPRTTKRGITYTPAKTVNYETFVREMFAVKYPDHTPWEGPVEMNIYAYFPIPASYSKKKIEQIKAKKLYPTKKPDADNIIKIITDALNGIAYRDDAQIVSIYLCKMYAEKTPRVDVIMGQLDQCP